MTRYRSRIFVAALSSCLATMGYAQSLHVPTDGSSRLASLDALDARVNNKSAYQHSLAARPGLAQSGLQHSGAQAQSVLSAIAALKQANPSVNVKLSNLTGAADEISGRRAALTGPAKGLSDDAVARNFMSAHGDLFGLTPGDVSDLSTLGDSTGHGVGVRMLRVEQSIDGRPVFQSETRFLFKKDGSLTKIVGQLVPGARDSSTRVTWSGAKSAPEAVASLLMESGRSGAASDFAVTSTDNGGRSQLSSNNDFLKGDLIARQVYFPLSPGVLVPAWSIVAFTTGDQDWYAVVDAQTGDLLWRKNIRDYASAQDAQFRVYVQSDGTTPAPSPAPNTNHVPVAPGSGTQFPSITPTVVSMQAAYDSIASPNGWIDDCPAGGCTANQTQTLGNNVLACMDQVNPQNTCDAGTTTVIDGNGRPTGNPDVNGRNRNFFGTTPRDFETNFLPPPQGGDPNAGQTATGDGSSGTAPIDQFRRGVITHLFYSLNWYHDKLFELGFDEAAGNFQLTNFSGQGLGNDRVLADVDDGSGTNNANFSTPPDGASGRMQMYRFTGPSAAVPGAADRDGALDAEVFLHEATHGVSNRLIGNAAGLLWNQARGMGEGWSDFVALSLLYNTNADDPNARYASGGYATYKLAGLPYTDNYVYGIRRFPYSTDNTVNPLTWADVDDVTNDLSGGLTPADPIGFNNNGGMEVHNIGEIWANTLWEVRSRIIADPAGANGDVPTGNHTMLQLVIDGMKMTPINPKFTDARDAILDADCTTNSCVNEDSIWSGFADRGLGYGASSPYAFGGRYVGTHTGVHESFVVPHLDVVDAIADVTIDDSASNNNGALDAGEAVKLSVALTNPWRSASKNVSSATATLSTTTPGVTIYQNSSAYGAIAAQDRVSGSSFVVGVDSSVACGTAIDFTLTTVSSLGTAATNFRLRVGARNGVDPVVTYTDTPASPIAIPDSSPRGVFHGQNVADDFEIASINFRADNITDEAVGDLSVMLRSPDGIGNDLIVLIDGLNDVGGSALTNMVIDDTVANIAANDMVQATTADAPYTKSWLPVYNAPWAALVNSRVPDDAVPELTRYRGTSTKGTWTVLAADLFTQAAAGGGTLTSWSILVTPVHFTCAAVSSKVNIAAAKTVSGSFDRNSTVTYTVTLTNNGNLTMPDNAGDEFTDVLPAGLTLVSASADSGTATANTGTNTVTWDGSISPLGSATITITATINANAGSTVSNQGTVSYASDGGSTNNTTVLTDDPTQPGAADPTVFTLNSANIAATKTVTGNFWPYQVVTYTVTLTNNGNGIANDNGGDEFTDQLPAGLTLRSATASAGTLGVGIIGSTTTVHWSGSLAAGASVTITIKAQIGLFPQGTVISNQGTVNYGAYEGSTNDTMVLTDDPSVGGATDPTTFTILDEIFRDGFEGN